MKLTNFTLTPIIISLVLVVVCSFQFKEAHTFVWHSSLLLLNFLGLLTAWIFRKDIWGLYLFLYVISFSVGLKRGQQAYLVDRNHYTNFYQWDDSNEFIIEIKNKKIILVLSQTTKINLEAMLQKNKLYLIVTDGSSYPSLKERWRKTCAKLKTPYYDTQKGDPYLFTSKTRNISF